MIFKVFIKFYFSALTFKVAKNIYIKILATNYFLSNMPYDVLSAFDQRMGAHRVHMRPPPRGVSYNITCAGFHVLFYHALSTSDLRTLAENRNTFYYMIN